MDLARFDAPLFVIIVLFFTTLYVFVLLHMDSLQGATKCVLLAD
jgi:hypothetical protein